MGSKNIPEEKSNRLKALVVGGGIAGMQAALEIADSEHHVYLVEKLPTVGGRMLQLDKTFPTLDCASCIGTPKMSQVGSNKYIKLITGAEVTQITGYAGNFKANIHKKSPLIDISQCTACGQCAEVCPVSVPSEWQLGMNQRKAVYRPFPQSVPNVFTIDKSACIECLACVDVCERKAIHHDMKDEDLTIDIGAIIIATGYDLFVPTTMPQYGYGRYDNVYTSLEFERLLSSTGPTEGQIQLKDGYKPQSAAIIHCVGSRDANYHEYCSRVCCMYGLKQAHLLKEKTGTDVYQMYIDMRCFGKGYEEFYRRVSDEGINFIRGKVAEVTNIPRSNEEKDKLVVIAEDTLMGQIIRVPVDMVILSVAIEPRHDSNSVAKVFGLKTGADGFFQEKDYKLDPMGTFTDGIFMAGCCQGPKDIPDTVSQSIGAAAKAIALVSRLEKENKVTVLQGSSDRQ